MLIKRRNQAGTEPCFTLIFSPTSGPYMHLDLYILPDQPLEQKCHNSTQKQRLVCQISFFNKNNRSTSSPNWVSSLEWVSSFLSYCSCWRPVQVFRSPSYWELQTKDWKLYCKKKKTMFIIIIMCSLNASPPRLTHFLWCNLTGLSGCCCSFKISLMFWTADYTASVFCQILTEVVVSYRG